MADMNAADVLGVDWARRARELLAGARNMERTTEIGLPRPGRPVPQAPTNPLYTALADPKLNRGLANLGEAAADVVLGRPSGLAAVDAGLGSVPGVGAAGILAAGGMPGLLDVAGLGELKNLAKIPKYTLEFVAKNFGEKGLRNLDNALTLYPKAGKPSVKDAVYIMKSGLGGEYVQAIRPYSGTDMEGTLAKLFRDQNIQNTEDFFNSVRDGYFALYRRKDLGNIPDKLLKGLSKDIENKDFFNAYSNAAFLIDGPGMSDQALKQGYAAAQRTKSKVSMNGFYQSLNLDRLDADTRSTLREISELEKANLQDWDKIVTNQGRKDAKKASKTQAAPAAGQPAPEPVPAPAPEPEPPTGWEATWDPRQGEYLYNTYGRNLSDKSKRGLFGVDSLAKHWAGELMARPGFSSAKILDGLDRADARHTMTNYNDVSRKFEQDIRKNIESGNIPGESIRFAQRYKNNMPVPGAVTPTLVLKIDEKPRVIDNNRLWADEAEGPDLYEMLFRPKVDRKLNRINPGYWE